MTRTFLPPPEATRCAAAIHRQGWAWDSKQRCLQRKAEGSDLCAKHQQVEAAGQHVVRVSPPREVA